MAIFSHPTLEMGAKVHVVRRLRLGHYHWFAPASFSIQDIARFLEILLYIRPEMKDAIRLQNALHVSDECRLDYASSTMPFFPPWIWKIDVDAHSATVRQEITKELETIA
jgi:hypothetical protein